MKVLKVNLNSVVFALVSMVTSALFFIVFGYILLDSVYGELKIMDAGVRTDTLDQTAYRTNDNEAPLNRREYDLKAQRWKDGAADISEREALLQMYFCDLLETPLKHLRQCYLADNPTDSSVSESPSDFFRIPDGVDSEETDIEIFTSFSGEGNHLSGP